jgi:hypothetical protein
VPKKTIRDFLNHFGEIPVIKEISTEVIKSENGRRIRPATPRARVMRPCDRCGELFSARDIRKHKCPKLKEEHA